MKSSCLLIVAFVCLTVCWAIRPAMAATNYYVATNGPGGAFTNWDTAASNIQDAINVTLAGDTVWVSNGVYNTGVIDSDGYGSNRVQITKAITVRSFNNYPTNTIIMGATDPGTGGNGPAAVRCVYMGYNTTLIGFTLTNGATLASGGGNGTIAGGAYCKGASPPSILSNCVIIGNTSTGGCGGVYYGTLYNCTLTRNWTTGGNGNGGGVRGGTSINCIVYFNTVSNGAEGVSNYYRVVFSNSCTSPSSNGWAVGNITNDPLFVDSGSGYGTNFVMGDYHLQNSSPCINAGNNAFVTTPTDLDGRRRIDFFNGIVDMGCYEYLPAGSMYQLGL